MEDTEAANAAIAALNNMELDGRELRVSEAQAKKPRQNNYR
jgi:RNA recognition motif-containing protein